MRKDWTGLCADCLSARPSPKKVYEDRILANGTIVQFSQEKDGKVPILYSKCRCVRWTDRQNAITNNCKYGAVCNDHRNNSSALYDLIMKRAGHSHENSKRGRGRKLGDRLLDTDQSVADIKNFVIEVWKESQLIDNVTQKAVASKFNLRGEKIGEKAVKRRLERAGLNMPWAEFRQSVLSEIGEL